MSNPDRDRLPQNDSLTALEPMGPHPEDYHQIERKQAELIAVRMEGIFRNDPGIAGTYHRGVNKGEHQWALYTLYQARLGRDAVGNELQGEDRLAVLNRGLGALQPALDKLDPERRQELASQASELKREIGSEIGDEVRDDPQSIAAADGMVQAAGEDPRQLVTKLTDMISRGKAVAAAASPGAALLENELRMGDVALEKVSIPTDGGIEEFDFASVRTIDNVVRAVDLLEAFIKLRELSEKSGETKDGLGQAAEAVEFVKVAGQIAKGVMDVGAMTARAVARFKGADDIVKHLDEFLAFGGNVGKLLSAADALNGIFVFLSDTSSDMEKADAVKNIVVFGVEAAEFAATRAAGTAAAGSTLASTAALVAHWGGPVATSIALTWEMLKWVGAETHEFHVTFSNFMMNHAFRTLAHHGREIGKHSSKLAALASAMEQQADPDIRAGIHDVWIKETSFLAAEIKAVAKVTSPNSDYLTPGAYFTIQDRFAALQANYGDVAEGDAAVMAGMECLAAIKDVLSHADDYVARESQREPDRQRILGVL